MRLKRWNMCEAVLRVSFSTKTTDDMSKLLLFTTCWFFVSFLFIQDAMIWHNIINFLRINNWNPYLSIFTYFRFRIKRNKISIIYYSIVHKNRVVNAILCCKYYTSNYYSKSSVFSYIEIEKIKLEHSMHK